MQEAEEIRAAGAVDGPACDAVAASRNGVREAAAVRRRRGSCAARRPAGYGRYFILYTLYFIPEAAGCGQSRGQLRRYVRDEVLMLGKVAK